MPSERYYLDLPLKKNDTLELSGSEFHHLAHVMRTRVGDIVEVVNGKGALAHALVKEIKKERASLKIENLEQTPIHPPRYILAQAMPKPNRLDFILEKGTELGVDIFWLFPSEMSIKKEIFPHQLERAKMLTIAAMKQCGRLTLPEIVFQPSLDKWPSLTQMTSFFGDLSPEAPLFEEQWKKIKNPIFPLLFITGPEAGFSEKEMKILKDQGAYGVKLHPNILRTDTAALTALALMTHWNFQSMGR